MAPAYAAAYPVPPQGVAYNYSGPGAIPYMQNPAARPRFRYLPWILVAVLAIALVGTFAVVGVMVDAAKKVSADLAKELDNIGVVLQMQNVRQRDIALNNFMDTAFGQTSGNVNDQFDMQAQLMRDYVNEAGKADMDKCPSDFVDAYKRDLAIYSDQANLLASHPHIPSDDELFVNSILHGVDGDFTYAETEQQQIGAWAQSVKGGYQKIKEGDQNLENIYKADRARYQSN